MPAPTSRGPQQPRGSQPQMGPAPKILRIGVILGDKIVEERLVRGREPVTIGQSAKNTFAIPTPDLPKSWVLFSVNNGRYVLNVSDSMDGRLSDGGQVMTMAQLKQSGRAQRTATGGWALPLSETARGKIVVGDMTLLFQFVLAPPLQPRPQLPHSVRGSIADSIDPYMAVVLGVSLLFHGFLFSYFKWWMDPPRDIPPDEIPEQFARVLIEKAPPPPVVEVDTGQGETEEAAADPGESEDKPKKKEDKPAGGSSDQAMVEQKVKNSAVIKVLGGAGGGGNSAFFDVTGGKDLTGDLDKGLARVGAAGGGLDVGPAGGLGGGVRSGGAGGGIEEGRNTGVAGPTGPRTTGREREEEEIRGTGSASEAEGEESGSLNPDVFTDTLKKRWYQQAQQCYERVLKTNPSIGGKIEVSLTVGVGGNVTKISVNGFNADVDACIESVARSRWRFPKPEEPSTFDFTFIFRKAK
jgi:hypothetical protein